MSVHHDMDDIANATTGGATTPEIMKMLSATLTKCVACHATWQLKAD
jgi:hypothetical protein